MPLWLQIELGCLPFAVLFGGYLVAQSRRMGRIEQSIVTNRRANRNMMLRIFPDKAKEIIADEERDIAQSV